MQDVQDEPLFCERVAGLDIAQAEVEVTIRVPSDTSAGRRQQETRTFGPTRGELESLGDWLACWGVTRIGMEATGVIRGPFVAPATERDRPLWPIPDPSQTGYPGASVTADIRQRRPPSGALSSMPLLPFPSQTRPRCRDLGVVQFIDGSNPDKPRLLEAAVLRAGSTPA